ncbi:MAG TPA: hypothetical protein VF134_05430 [Candidatus Dormibacteraeota bacterium]
MDVDGYGFPSGERTIGRLISDIRTLSQLGVERVAEGWDRHGPVSGRWHEAEQAALHAIEEGRRGEMWDEVRRQLFGLTESGQALIVWQSEHGEVGHKAERAAYGAALALLAGDLLDRETAAVLTRPMGEALPWLNLESG